MCGIVGIVGNAEAVGLVMQGLARLEYRGYDSAGVAVADAEDTLASRKAAGKLAALRELLEAEPLPAATSAIGHTRWATHGKPTAENAHPHSGVIGSHKLAVVHNGIIENHQTLRTRLSEQGAAFISETDTETIPFALAAEMETGSDMLAALGAVARAFEGSFAVAALPEGHTDTLLAARRGAPLCLGLGGGFNACASDPLALAGVCEKFIFLEDGDCALVTGAEIRIIDASGTAVERPVKTLDLSDALEDKQGYRHFMLKEIHEQPAVIAHLLEAYTTADGTLKLPLDGLPEVPTHINIVACGTAYYAGMAAKYMLEELAGVPVNVDVASEFRYRTPPLAEGGLFIAVSQSGETADTLAALEHAREHGQTILALVNVPTSSIARAADAVLPLHAGNEIAVASTKAFLAMLMTLTLLALHFSRKSVSAEIAALRQLPLFLTDLLAHTKPLEELAETLLDARSMLYLGRGVLAPIAYEGALKIKEISYIHAEGYASGEMKHGPIALIEPDLPVVNLASGVDGLFDKTLSNLREVEARHGRVILITDASGAAMLDESLRDGLSLITIPDAPKIMLPIVFTIPLQLLAYYTAVAKGTDVDQPRNLAKSVTVE